MAATIKIPATFTAVDKFSHVIGKMAGSVKKFATTGVSAISRFDQRLSAAFSKMGRLSQLAIGAGLGGIFLNGIKSIKDYETAIASFRTIVSDLSDKEFAGFKNEIRAVAKETRTGSIDVAKSFEKIAGLNAKFAETEKGIGLVSKAAITLSKASGDDLGTSAENLVGIMNQFSLGAKEADRTINVLAAGQAAGAASITQTAEAFKNFGSVAAGSNISLEQSVGLIQTLGKFSVFGAEAGTKLKSSILRLQKAGVGYSSGQFNINDALEETIKKFSKLSTSKQKDALLSKVFGADNVNTGRILVTNIDIFKEFTKGVTGTSEAQIAAGINTNTLSWRLKELKWAWDDNIIGLAEAGSGLDIVKSALRLVADNIGSIVNAAIRLIIFVGIIKAITTAMKIGQGIMAGYTAVMAFYESVAITAALGTGSFATALWAATWPILAIIAVIALVVAAFYYWDDITAWFVKQWDKFTGFLTSTWDGVVSFFKDFDFMGFFKDIGQSILKFMLAPLTSVLSLLSHIPGKIGDLASLGLDKIGEITGEIGTDADVKKPLDSPTMIMKKSNDEVKEAMIKGGIDINLRDPGKMVESAKNNGPLSIPINLNRTQGAF